MGTSCNMVPGFQPIWKAVAYTRGLVAEPIERSAVVIFTAPATLRSLLLYCTEPTIARMSPVYWSMATAAPLWALPLQGSLSGKVRPAALVQGEPYHD